MKKLFSATENGGASSSSINLQVNNQTGSTLYVYNFPYGAPTTVSAQTIGASQTQNVPLTMNASTMRVFFANQELNCIQNLGVPPDEFGEEIDIPFNFVEYATSASSLTCFDLSFLDSVSYPCTFAITSGGTTTTWGLTQSNFTNVISALNSSPWQYLVQQNNGSVIRILGPNKAMMAPSCAPKCAKIFALEFPPTGYNMPGQTQDNWNTWQNSTTIPATTQYVQAFHNNSTPQMFQGNNIYGYFLFPLDNLNGQFNNVPNNVTLTYTIYSQN